MDVGPPDTATLTCWKDIASYLGKGVRTVQRWEQEFGLPVRRPNGISHKSPVSADPRDLDAWLKSRWSVRAERADPAREHGQGAAQTGDGIFVELRESVQQSSDLQARVRLARQQHHDLVREVTAAATSLSQTCRLMLAGKKAQF